MRNTGHALIDWALSQPRRVVRLMLGTTLLAVALAVAPTLLPGGLGPLPTIEVDVDPENMLEPDEPARVRHDASKARFGLHDAVVVGVVNDAHPEGIFNAQTLSAVHRLTEVGKGLPGVVAPDVMSLSTVDSIENAGPGAVAFSWLMAKPPANAEAAAQVRARAERIPFLRDTLFAGDGQAAVVYLPLQDKSYAHDVSLALQEAIAELEPDAGAFHIAGLPVAEETFGIEMFVQMAISAPAAMLVIFLLMWLFFRRLIVIVSPMIVAMVSVLTTMALLVLSGQTIHIMSSMIPIFIMPIAVLDAVHIISDFFDRYHPADDRRDTIRSVMRHLFSPMLFTSMTTAAGFASLALTPIPPVRVFGIFVAVGVVLAWLWTILFIPAFLVSLDERRLIGFGRKADGESADAATGVWAWIDRFTHDHAKLVVVSAAVALAGAGYGISLIQINDNPTRWFESDHPIRVADRELNAHFGGTYDAFLALDYEPEPYTPETYAVGLRKSAEEFRSRLQNELQALSGAIGVGPAGDPLEVIEHHEEILRERRRHADSPAERAALNAGLDLLAEAFAQADSDPSPAVEGYREALASQVRSQARAIDAGFAGVPAAIEAAAARSPADEDAMRSAIEAAVVTGDTWKERPVAAFLGASAQTDEAFKRPELLRWVEGLQAHLAEIDAVGKSSSISDIVKTVHRDLLSGQEEDYRVPETASVVAQTLDQYMSSHRKDDLWHFVTPDYRHAEIWLQLTSGDNQRMEQVVKHAEAYLKAHPAPLALSTPSWFGLTYINVVWQDQMVSGMLNAFLGSFVVVLVMMVFLFRSPLWGLLSMLPLTVTVAVIYGLIGVLGKDYDMPVAVLSSLSLGLAVDYAIHFLVRSRDLVALHGSWDAARSHVFGEPARAIGRNIVVVGVGFLPLLLAPLVPYQTVGVLIASILLLAGAASLLLLPALITLLHRQLFERRPLAKSRVKHALPLLLAVSTLAASPAAATEPGVEDIVQKTNHAAYYLGKDGRARVKMTITDKQGRTRVREMTILRRDVEDAKDGEQMFYVYFHEPADVAKTVFLVHKKVGADDDRWLYLPSLDLVKRIAAADKRTSFVGSDFVYEDVSGRPLSEDHHRLVETTKNYYVLEHVPRNASSVRFSRYVMYVHRGTFLPTKVEYYDKANEKYRVMTVDSVETVQGHPTVTRATMEDLEAGSKTTVEYSKVVYDLDLPERIFTERYLRRMPVQYLQ